MPLIMLLTFTIRFMHTFLTPYMEDYTFYLPPLLFMLYVRVVLVSGSVALSLPTSLDGGDVSGTEKL